MSAQPGTAPDEASGTAIGTSAASTPVVEANAETSAAIMQMTSAARSGEPMAIASRPSRFTASSFCSTPT